MGRRFTLDEYLETFTDEETESVQDAIAVRVSDAEVHSLGLVFIQLMGGVLQTLRNPPNRRRRCTRSRVKQDRSSEDLAGDMPDEFRSDEDDLIH